MRKAFITMLMVLMALIAFPVKGTVIDSYVVKSVYIHNFIRFVRFYPPLDLRNISFCTLGEDPFGTALQKAASQSPTEVYLQLHRGISLADLDYCNIVFISSSEEENLERILRKIADKPILTLADMGGFAEKGGIIEFVDTDEGVVRLIINKRAAKQAGLTIDTMLLEVASKVIR